MERPNEYPRGGVSRLLYWQAWHQGGAQDTDRNLGIISLYRVYKIMALEAMTYQEKAVGVSPGLL